MNYTINGIWITTAAICTAGLVLFACESRQEPSADSQADSTDAPKPLSQILQEEAEKMLGTEAPDFTLQDTDGRTVKLLDHRGKDVVILDFWATWCVPCLVEMPIIASVVEGYADKNVVLYAINQREDAQTIQNFLKRKSLGVRILLDADGAVSDAFNVRSIPETIIIDKQGIVRAVHVGFDTRPGRVEADLKEELDVFTSEEAPAQ